MAIPDGKPATDFSAMNREWVRDVAAEAASAEGLPSVSGSDNGKVLTVVSGDWAAATPAASGIPAPANPSNGDVLTYDGTSSAWVAAAPSSGGSDIFYIEVSSVDEVNHTFTLSTSISDIIGAIQAEKQIFLRDENMYHPVLSSEVEGGYVAFFASDVKVYNGTISYVSFDYEYEDGAVTTATFTSGSKQW